MSDARYTPPPIPGYVFFSNFGTVDAWPGDDSPNSKEKCAERTSERFDIPVEDVLVIDFTPDGPLDPNHDLYQYSTAFASYVLEKHREKVFTFREVLRAQMDFLEYIAAAEGDW